MQNNMRKNRKLQLYGLVAVLVSAPTVMANAADRFDGTGSLVCTVHRLYECDGYLGCQLVPAATADDIRHLEFDFADKTVRLEHWDAGLTSSIDRVATVDENLIVQGVDSGHAMQADGAGWTLSVDRKYGTMVLTVSGRDVAFVGLGSCVSGN